MGSISAFFAVYFWMQWWKQRLFKIGCNVSSYH